MAHHPGSRMARHGLLAFTAAAGLAGCATTWDDVTSRDFHVRSMWEHTDPMTVLHESTDGDKRAKASVNSRSRRRMAATTSSRIA